MVLNSFRMGHLNSDFPAEPVSEGLRLEGRLAATGRGRELKAHTGAMGGP
jgi:hypothetical protein